MFSIAIVDSKNLKMKHTLTTILLFISLSVFSQSGTSASPKIDTPIKHDTVQVLLRSYYDTIKVEISYLDKTYVRVTSGFQIRQIQTNSSQPNRGIIVWSSLYDDKWKPFTKILFAPPSQIL